MKMPILQPVPIKTKDAIWPVALWRWLTSIRKWRMVEDYAYFLKHGAMIVIPKDFVFDGASIPRIFWMILSPTGLLLIPGLLHDYAYRNDCLLTWIRYEGDEYPYIQLVLVPAYHRQGRAHWDRMFREEAICINGFHIINYVAWIALRLFGWIVWNKHRRAEKLVNNSLDMMEGR